MLIQKNNNVDLEEQQIVTNMNQYLSILNHLVPAGLITTIQSWYNREVFLTDHLRPGGKKLFILVHKTQRNLFVVHKRNSHSLQVALPVDALCPDFYCALL